MDDDTEVSTYGSNVKDLIEDSEDTVNGLSPEAA